MKNLILLLFLICFNVTWSQNYQLVKEPTQLSFVLNDTIAASAQLKMDSGIVGNYTFEDRNIIVNGETIATYDCCRLYVNESVYKYRTPAFSSFNKIKDKTTGEHIATLFQESNENVVVTIHDNKLNQNSDILTSWMLYMQLKDFEQSQGFDWVTPAITGALAAFFIH